MKLSDFPSKFSATDKIYLEKRKAFSEFVGEPKIYDWIDHFPLYAGVQTLGTKLATYEIFKESLSIPGHVVEFGTWKGANLLFLAKTLKLLQPNSAKLLFGFDNFAGLPTGTPKDGKLGQEMTGQYCGDEEILRKAIETFGFEDYVHLVVGDALETIPLFQENNPEFLVSFAYIDFDLYSPVKCALEFLSQRLSVGGIIVFDEAISSLWPGETIAMLEFLEKSDQKFKMISNTLSPQPSLYLQRVE